MPNLLTRNGKLIRMPSGKLARRVPGQACYCCGSPTCETCAAQGDLPALRCHDQTGMIVNIAGIVLATEYDDGVTGTTDITWDGGNSISGTFCVYAYECQTEYVLLAPVKTGTVNDTSGDYPLKLYLFLRWNCGGSGAEPGTAGPDGDTAYWEAYIIGTAQSDDGFTYVVAFSTKDDIGGFPTYLAATRDCTRAGYAIANAAPYYGFSSVLDTYSTLGTGGTITTGAACSNSVCASSCITTGVTITFTGGPMNGITLDADLDSGCAYVIDDPDYTGSINVASVPLGTGFVVMPAFRLVVTRLSDGVQTFNDVLFCDGQPDPAIGRYGETSTYAVVS